jgi:hypothetical protein
VDDLRFPFLTLFAAQATSTERYRVISAERRSFARNGAHFTVGSIGTHGFQCLGR